MEFDTATWMKRLGYAALTAAILSSAVYYQDQSNIAPAGSWTRPEDVSYILIKPSDVHRESLWGDEVSDELQRRALSDLLISPGMEAAPFRYYCDEYTYSGQYYSECFNYYYDPYVYYYYYYDNEDYAGPITFTPEPDDDDETDTPTPEPDSDSSDQSDSDSSDASSDGSSDSSSKKKVSSDSSDRSQSDSSDASSDGSSDSSEKKKDSSDSSEKKKDSSDSSEKKNDSSDSSGKKDSSEGKNDSSDSSGKENSSDESSAKKKDSSDSSGKKDSDSEVDSEIDSDSDDTPTPEPSEAIPVLPPLPPALVGATLGDLQSNADQVANLINMPVALMVVSADPSALADHLTNKKTMKAVADNGGGADLLMFLSDDDRVKSTLVQLDNVMDGLFAGQDLGNIGITETQKGLLDLQNTDADVAYLIAAILAAEDGMNPNLVRFYEMKGSSTAGVLDSMPSGGVMSTAIVDDNIDPSRFAKTGGPGEEIYCFKHKLTESEYTSILTGLQDIALEDDLKYSSFTSSKRKRAIESDVKSLVKDLGFPGDGKDIGKIYDNCIYYASSNFQRKYAEGVAEAGSLHSSDVTVSLVALLETKGGKKKDNPETAVFFTAHLQKGRCFLCDRRDQSSSETDSSEGSDFKSSSAVSSSQQNFRDSARYSCPKNSGRKVNNEKYPVTLGQFLFTFPCDTCGWTVSTCPEHKRQWDAYASEQHVLWTFTGSEAVEASKHLGGTTLVNPYKVPNKKVFYQENGRPATSDQFKKFTATVDGAKIVIPIKS